MLNLSDVGCAAPGPRDEVVLGGHSQRDAKALRQAPQVGSAGADDAADSLVRDGDHQLGLVIVRHLPLVTLLTGHRLQHMHKPLRMSKG